MKLNCWEAKQCGRQPRGEKVDEFGVCPASNEERLHGINSGINGGRACWTIDQTMCGETMQGVFTEKLAVCFQCDFYALVREEEGHNFALSSEILAKFNKDSLFNCKY